jgi:nitrite reductase (NADH) small subunit/3-phenylpropionate/trans-cinnamate dioxygenase ferredoxin subunit
MTEFITVAKVGDIPEGRGKPLKAGDREIAVFLVGGKYYAMTDYCPHMGASLGVSGVFDDMVICDRHQWAFKLADGSCPDVPGLQAETYEVRLQGDEIQVRLPEGDDS